MATSNKALSPELVRAFLAIKRAEITAIRAADPWRATARPNQIAPPGDWTVWLRMAGRGEGKTRSGAEWVREEVMAGRRRRIALVARTAADARDVMVEGESGILACCERYMFDAVYQPSRRRIVFGNGARAYLYSAEEPNLLRGPQHDGYWADEVAAWARPDAWDQLQFGARLRGPLGDGPRGIATTTPRPVAVIRRILARAGVSVSRGSTYDNRAHLAAEFFSEIITQYEGTRIGRQELLGELLDALEGALWNYEQLDGLRVAAAPELVRVVVAIDPPASDGPRAAECGIVAVGLGQDGRGYVLADASRRGSPAAWANAAWDLAESLDADALVFETNQGGEMVAHTLRVAREGRAGARSRRLIGVRASRGKLLRAEPVAALYEQGRVHHVGTFGALEDQLCTYLPEEQARRRRDETGEGQLSPDRLDALVWGLTEVMLQGMGRSGGSV
ncbi:MAG: DNA-packaging protein [Thermomicrobiales bacterium]